jgi:Flp pilus assembly protein TadG
MVSKPYGPHATGTKRRASTAVEFAVVAPVFFAFILGMVEVGRGLMVQHLLLNAARQGCRTGILPSNGTSQIQDAVSTALAPSNITVTSDNVSVTVNGASADPLNANSGDTVTVTVTVAFSSVSWLPSSSFLSGNLSAQYTLLKQ